MVLTLQMNFDYFISYDFGGEGGIMLRIPLHCSMRVSARFAC
jgi:hypothetical protein